MTTGQTRTCGCGKVVPVESMKACVCECHNTGLTYEQLRASRTTCYLLPWGTVTAVRFDHIFNLQANFKDVDGGVSISIDFADGCSCGTSVTADGLLAYLAKLEQATPKIVAAIEKRRALAARMRPLNIKHSAQAGIMFALVRTE